MAIERGQVQETLNRSLAWATGYFDVQWLVMEEEGRLARQSNVFCLAHNCTEGV